MNVSFGGKFETRNPKSETNPKHLNSKEAEEKQTNPKLET